MHEQIWQMNLAGHSLRYRLRDADTVRYFHGSMSPCEGAEFDVAVDETKLSAGRRLLPSRSAAYVECKLLIPETSRRLLRWNACLIHAAAFAWKGHAWLLTGPSGVGKTTQFCHWKRLFGDEVRMICGDMPVVALRSDGGIEVCPSPWNGKEGLYGDVSAPLGGTIVLEQGECNTIERISPRDAFSAAFSQFACIPDTVQEINVFSSLVDRTLSQYPVWKLRNRGDAAAAAMTRDALASYLSERRQSNDPI